jgi:hypothetical protein
LYTAAAELGSGVGAGAGAGVGVGVGVGVVEVEAEGVGGECECERVGEQNGKRIVGGSCCCWWCWWWVDGLRWLWLRWCLWVRAEEEVDLGSSNLRTSVLSSSNLKSQCSWQCIFVSILGSIYFCD